MLIGNLPPAASCHFSTWPADHTRQQRPRPLHSAASIPGGRGKFFSYIYTDHSGMPVGWDISHKWSGCLHKLAA